MVFAITEIRGGKWPCRAKELAPPEGSPLLDSWRLKNLGNYVFKDSGRAKQIVTDLDTCQLVEAGAGS